MSTHTYSNRYIKIYKSKNGYVVHNTRKHFELGHTHITNFNTAKYLTGLVIHQRVNNKLSKYLLVSLLRLSNDEEYSLKIQNILNDL